MRMGLFGAQSVTLALLLLACAPSSKAQTCVDYFSSLADNLIDAGDILVYQLPTPVSELTTVGTELLSFDWADNALGEPQIDQAGSDIEYLEGVVTAPSMIINTISSLESLPDYGIDWATVPKNVIQLKYNFPVNDINATYTNCALTLKFSLEDINTVTPATDTTEYSISVREDFPLSLPIPYLEVIAQDYDGTSPNNLLMAIFDAGCPLSTVQPNYDGQGKDVSMTFMLTQKLDYDTMEGPDLACQVSVTDGGTNPGPLSTDVTITITVEGFEDEPPVFERAFYSTFLDSQQAPTGPLTILPAAIIANDADKDGTAITYTMASYDGSEWDGYFAIDGSTAEVTQVADLPDSMLGDYATHFILTATDGNDNSGTSVLEIVLPTATTTNETTTPPSSTTSASGGSSSTDPDVASSAAPTDPASTAHPPSSSGLSTADGSSTVPPTGPATGASTPVVTDRPTNTTTTPESYMFERAAYNFEVYPTSSIVATLFVVRVDDPHIHADYVFYAWDDETSASTGAQYFTLDSSSGQVSVSAEPELGSYSMKATAVVAGDSNTLTTDVFINVIKPPSCNDTFISQGLIFTNISESSPAGTAIVKVETEGDNEDTFCKVRVQPTDFYDAFEVSDEGVLTLSEQLDADSMTVGERSVAVWIKALEENEPCPTDFGDTDRSEVIVVVNIEDENDEAPKITQPSSNTSVGYPENRALQQVVGPVVNIVVEDKDTVGDLQLSLSGDGSNLFLLEKATGNLYLADPSSCSDSCQVIVSVSDGGKNDGDRRSVTVIPLNTDNIYDITFYDKNTSDIQNEIQQLSNSSGFDLHILYTSVGLSDGDSDEVRVAGRVMSSSQRRMKRSVNLRDNSWVSVAHIYAFDDDGEYVSLGDLNENLPVGYKASTFAEKETFSPEETDVTGYQVAVGILGGLLALILIGAVVGFVWYRKKQRKAPEAFSQPSTLGAAYPNHAFNTEMSEIARGTSSSTSSNGDARRVSVLVPATTAENILSTTAPVQDLYDDVIQSPFDVADDPRTPARDFSYTNGDVDRKSSYHSLGGLHRIDPGPSPDGTKSSPYLTGSEGGFEASRPTEDETVASFTAYKGGQKLEESQPIKVNTSYAPQHKKEPYVTFGSTSEIIDEEPRSRAESGASSKKSPSGYGVSVRVKKEPPDVSAATPAKPIMKASKKKSVSVEVHQEPEAPLVAGSFSNLQSSPTVKKKKKTKTNSSSDEDSVKTKEGATESGMSDSETKKSVAFKVLVDQKEIERINHDDDSENENL